MTELLNIVIISNLAGYIKQLLVIFTFYQQLFVCEWYVFSRITFPKRKNVKKLYIPFNPYVFFRLTKIVHHK